MFYFLMRAIVIIFGSVALVGLFATIVQNLKEFFRYL